MKCKEIVTTLEPISKYNLFPLEGDDCMDAGGRMKQDAYRDVGGRECLEQILEPESRIEVGVKSQTWLENQPPSQPSPCQGEGVMRYCVRNNNENQF